MATRSDGPHRNRVTPLGDIVATELRGAWTGNRGRLHDGTRIVRFHGGNLWITCALRFKDWHHEQWAPNTFTWLFFHDEAVSLAAGHRPCALCRRDAYNAYRNAWAAGLGTPVPSAAEMNARLHAERIVRGTHRRRLHPMAWPDLPDATFVVHDDTPALVLGDRLVPWTPAGYGIGRARPASGTAQVITPPAGVAVLRGGYAPQVDAAALNAQILSG